MNRPARGPRAPRRCGWAKGDPLYVAYHDSEWGAPSHDDRHLFEMLVLEGAQAGLSWLTILRRRAGYREVFDRFAARKVAAYTPADIAARLADPRIIRNRLKVESAVRNARAFLEVAAEAGTFDAFIWQFVDGAPRQNRWRSLSEVPAETAESRTMSRELRRRGFTFVGPTICYAFMQAVGMLNDHLTTCFRHRELKQKGAG
ncbi:MAG TPA: DNA-3-methyladenine glycosylase I [Thermoanaerobaculia bacterium]|nr:DNA-3-methyladenine glycosylase I [Thermoanaerobaculia bacterium]